MQFWGGEALAQNNLGVLHYEEKEYQAALTCFQDARAALEKAGDRSGQLSVQINIALIQEALGQLRAAELTLTEARELAQRWQMPSQEARICVNLGVIRVRRTKLPAAKEALESALAVAEPAGDVEAVRLAYHDLGFFYRSQGKWGEAAAAYQKATEAVEQLRSGAREPFLALGLFQKSVSPYYFLAYCRVEQKDFPESFAAAERAKARALMDVLLSGKADVRKGMSDDERRQEQRLQGRLKALAVEGEALRGPKGDPRRRESLAGEWEQARRDYAAFRRDLFLRLPELQTRRAEFRPASLLDLNRSLFAPRPKLVVLSYLVGATETLLFVLARGEEPGSPARLAVHRIDKSEKELDEKVQEFCAACRKSGGGAPDLPELYEWLLGPAEATLAGADHVVVVADGVLLPLPFHALRDGDGDDPRSRYLIQRCAVSYAPSVTALLKTAEAGRGRRRQPAADPGGLLAVGVGDFGGRERPLPAAEPEARAIAALFAGRAEVLPGRRATKANLSAAWAGRRVLHLATHGRLNEDVPLYSAVVLSQDGATDEGVLYAAELLDEELSAELVVLSACQTGLGRRTRGEGLLGMTWAWFVAGVPSTVASQWPVADDSTARLMQAFYAELKNGTPKAEALRRAQLALLKDRKTRHPFFWAPFVLTGDPW
jgi:CHAT domain-containing protein/tetratricopeptide (TPR) repeat protein